MEPLPAGKPNDFLGTFENLQVEVKVNVDSVDVNQAFNFEVVYSGKGNLKLLRSRRLNGLLSLKFLTQRF